MAVKKPDIKVIISGGGTGGHIFPALAIANALKQKANGIDILFVGALGKMEMEKVPAAGYKIIGLPVVGLQRRLTFSLFLTIYKLLKSLILARKIISNFKPDVVVGVGGYASGPVLRVAVKKKIPALIQEQNSFAGVTNKILGNKVNTICVAYEEMEKYFPKEKIVLTGNPVRKDFINTDNKIEEGRIHFGIKSRQVVFITGGSLGARMLNEALMGKIDLLRRDDLFIIWQTGKLYLEEMKQRLADKKMPNIILLDFVSRMDLAYAVANVVVCRSGALTCAELAVTAKAAVLVPSPNVAEDHQTKNALALVNKNAAIMVKDSEAKRDMIVKTLELLDNKVLQNKLIENIKKQSRPFADEQIAEEVLKLVN